MTLKNINHVQEKRSNLNWYNQLLEIENINEYAGITPRVLREQTTRLWEFNFADGSRITIDICRGNTNYYDNCVWYSHDDKEAATFDCSYSFEQTMEFTNNLNGNTYICVLDIGEDFCKSDSEVSASEKEWNYDWIIGIGNSAANGVKMLRFQGTKEDVKYKLISLVQEDKESDLNCWERGTENIEDVRSEDGLGYEFYAYGCYHDYHIDYTAKELAHIYFE